jgi:hypothetical protein
MVTHPVLGAVTILAPPNLLKDAAPVRSLIRFDSAIYIDFSPPGFADAMLRCLVPWLFKLPVRVCHDFDGSIGPANPVQPVNRCAVAIAKALKNVVLPAASG